MGNSPIVARINSVLAEKGILKKEFFDACNITSATYSQWNTGKTHPKVKNLEVIAKYLGVNVEYLQTGLGEKEKPVPTDEDELGKMSGWKYYELSEENRALVDQMIEKLLKSQSDE